MNDLLDGNDGLDRGAGACDAEAREPEGAADAGTVKTDFEALREEADVLRDEAARAKADLYNYRARVERDRKRDRELAAENAVMSLLPVLDNLERALEAESDKDSSMYKGISMVQRQFFSALQGLGLKVIEASGAFDPALHDAISIVDVDGDELDGAVMEVFHKGYTLGDKVLQAAKVKVGRKKTGENDENEK
jgi:molecular chaperone GrpE